MSIFLKGVWLMNETLEQLITKNRELNSNNRLLAQELKDCKKENQKLRKQVKELESAQSNVEQMTIGDV